MCEKGGCREAASLLEIDVFFFFMCAGPYLLLVPWWGFMSAWSCGYGDCSLSNVMDVCGILDVIRGVAVLLGGFWQWCLRVLSLLWGSWCTSRNVLVYVEGGYSTCQGVCESLFMLVRLGLSVGGGQCRVRGSLLHTASVTGGRISV